MNLDPLTLGLLKINYLVVNLNKKNFKQTSQDLLQLISDYGLEAENQTLRYLLTEAAKTAWDSDRSSTVAVNSIHATLLAQHLTSVLNHPAKSTVICRTVDNPTRFVLKILKTTSTLLNRLSRLLKLTTVEDVAFSLSLKKHSSKPEIVALAKAHLKKRFLDLVQCYLDAERGHNVERAGLQDCSPEVLQTLLTNLTQDGFGLANVTKELFLDRLRIDFPREVVPIVLAPLLYQDDTRTPLKEMTTVNDMATAMVDTSLPEALRDIGYAFTASVEDCKSHMLNFGSGEPTTLDIARILTVMMNYHNMVQEGPAVQTPGNFWTRPDIKKNPITHQHHNHWNLEVFVQTLKELAPKLNWKEVILQLDHPEFNCSDREALTILITSLKLGLQKASYPPEMFPADYFCGRWKNLEGQMSLITHILKNSDVFSFGDHLYLVSIDLLKSPPDVDNKDISMWRSIYLVELLLYAADHGYYLQVHDLFKFPLQHCPDILALVLLQINPPITGVRQELLTLLVVTFLGNHPNSTVILHLTWDSHHSTTKSIMMHAMAEWYLRGEHDQTKLSRILDIAQDLKSLSLLLNVSAFPFVIDLACLASRRDYLKLDKWLTDKIRDHGETFITALVKFLQRRCPGVVGKVSEEQRLKTTKLPRETVFTMMSCLQPCITNVQPELQEAICNVITSYQTFLSNKRPLGGLARPHSRLLDTQLNPALIGHVMTPQPSFAESMTSLTTNTANLNLGASSNTAFAMPSTLGSLVNPASPSRLMGAGLSPFAMMPMVHNSNINLSALARMPPTPLMDKPRMPEQSQYPEMMQSVAKEIEDEVNGYFQRIYNHPPHPTLSIDEVLEMLKKFQVSPNKREREVFSCMLRNLFEEYKFFPQYPDKELYITAQLLGGIIDKDLVPSYVSFGLALRFVLDALRKPEGSKMYYFGVAALDRFKSRLKEYSQYCEHVRGIPHFGDFPPHLIEYVEYGLQSQEPPTKPQGPVLPTSLANILNQNTHTVPPPFRSVPPSLPVAKVSNTAGALGSRPSIAIATNIDTLLTATEEEKINTPPESIQDKTAFIFNNLSQLNLQIKCDELKEIITEEYYPWLSQYLVMKRASIELNFHTLYSNFLDVLKIQVINKMVTKETFRNIKVLLRSDKGIANFSDRSLLKNLGHWLGMLTLARNFPILHLDIDLKGLILEAYYKGPQELLYVVPFVAKILQSCAKSNVFKPPNPWTMALMNVLAELHQEPDLKLNLKFEIEVLCKNLSLDIVLLKPTLYLKDPEKLKHIDFYLSQPKSNLETASAMLVSQPLVPNAQLQSFPAQAQLLLPEEFGANVSSNMLQGETSFMCGITLPEPRFNYAEVNVNSTSSFSQKICVNPHILLLQSYPHLKDFVKTAVERSIQEWIHPVVDRSIKYSLTTCEQIIRKDFALDADEVRMRVCAHHMMRNLTAAVAMITCREQIITTIHTHLKAAFINATVPTNIQQDIIDNAAAVLSAENMELACSFIQKTAVEKALPELDKRLATDYELRRLSRLEGRRYYDPMVLKVVRTKVDERICQTLGELTHNQLSVYNEFACNIPGFTPVRDAGLFAPKPQIQETVLTDPTLTSTQVFATAEMMSIISAAEMFINTTMGINSLLAQTTNMHLLLDCLLVARRNSDINSGCTLLRRAVEGILEIRLFQPAGEHSNFETMSRYRDLHLRVLRLFDDPRVCGHLWTTKQITCYIVKAREELRFNFEAIDFLIRNHLVNLPQFDIALMHLMENGNNFKAITFAMQLVQVYFIDDRSFLYVDEADLHHTTEMLFHIASLSRPMVPEGLGTLMATLRTYQEPACLGEGLPVGPTTHFHAGMMFVCDRKLDDPPGLQERTKTILREWRNLELHPIAELDLSQNFTLFVNNMKMNPILKTDDLLFRFFRNATQFCIQDVYMLLKENPKAADREKYYALCDSLTRLTTLIIKNAGDEANPLLKLNVLNKVLGVIAGHILVDQQDQKTKFHQLPYHRLIIILFLDMTEPALDSMSLQIATAFCQTLHSVRPSLAPGFCYAWLEIISHRAFLTKIMLSPTHQKTWSMFSTLLIDLFKFVNPFLRNTEMAPPVQAFYKGIMKLLLVLLHDFPGFLCDYHYGFCDEIAPNCIQMRNLILSAFPNNMRLPDPFTPNLKVDLLPEIALPPRGYLNFSVLIPSAQFKKDLETYLTTRAPATFLAELKENLQVKNDPSCHYNIKLINAVVLFVGTRAISHIRSNGQTPSKVTIANSAHMDIFQKLMEDLDSEGRYLFLNAIANQLRYPNSHTHYFSCCVLYLFGEANSEAVQEQITRTLLERLIVNRPHPWGLLVTFIELIKNPVYKFWSHDFVHCAPEIEKLFTSVARSCMANKSGVEGEDKQMLE